MTPVGECFLGATIGAAQVEVPDATAKGAEFGFAEACHAWAIVQEGNEFAAVVAPSPDVSVAVDNGVSGLVLRACLADRVRAAFAGGADPGVTFRTGDDERGLRVYLGDRWDKLETERIDAICPLVDGYAELDDGIEKGILCDGIEHFLYRRSGYGLGAAAGRHLALVGCRLFDLGREAFKAAAVAAGKSCEVVGDVASIAAAQAGAV